MNPTLAETSDTATVPVMIRVVGVEPVKGHGKLVGLAVVAIDTAGVVVTLQGVQVIRLPTGQIEVRAPCFRRPNGSWVPAALLPPEVAQGVADEVRLFVQ